MNLFRRSFLFLHNHCLVSEMCAFSRTLIVKSKSIHLNNYEGWFRWNVRCLSLSTSCYNEVQPKKIKKQPPFSTVHQVEFFNYLRQNPSYFTDKPLLSQEDSEKLLEKPLNQVTNDELPIFVCTIIMRNELSKWLQRDIDNECVLRLNSLSTSQLLRLVDAWLYIVPNILNTLQFYAKTADKFDQILRESSCDSPQFIQTYFYVSLYKNKAMSKIIIQTALDKLQKQAHELRPLSMEELAIISLSTFRTSVVCRSRLFLQLISDTIKSNLDTLLLNDFYFSCLIKLLRPAEFLDVKLLDEMARKLTALESMHFVTKIHIFALFAESLYSNESFLQQFGRVIGLELKEMLERKETMTIRVKDVSRFLWSLSYLGVVPAVDDLDREVMDKINDWIDGGYFDGANILSLVSMMCSIFVLNWKYDDLFSKAFKTYSMDRFKVPNFPKNLLVLNVLVSGLSIEAPHLISNEMLEQLDPSRNSTVKKHLLTRPLLKQLRNSVWLLTKKMNITEIQCHFNIPYLQIIGMTFRTPKGNFVCVEVLDSTNCLVSTSIPTGLMKLKLRLIKHLNQHLFVIDALTIDPMRNNFVARIENLIKEIDEKNPRISNNES